LVCHTQTGQLRQCADSLLAPLLASGEVQLDVFDPKPQVAFPFPWPIPAFLDVMPESVLEIPPPMQPMRLPHDHYDLVILAWQVWYLAPSLPVTAFLASEQAKVLSGTPVVVLCACRNMWHAGWLKLKAKLDQLGARVLDHVVVVDQGAAWATFVTTPRWLWTGKKNAFGPFPAAGVAQKDIDALAPLGERLRDALLEGRLDGSVLKGATPAPVAVVRKYVLPEFLAGHVFGWWAKLIRGAGKVWKGFRFPFSVAFILWLYAVIVLLLPILVLTAIVVRVGFKGWFNARVSRLAAPSGGDIL
jgi:hypothetical protein